MSVWSKLFGPPTAEVDPAEAQELVRSGALLIDVRELSEWTAGHAPNAEHHPIGRLAVSMSVLPEHRALVVVCRSGNRSARATKMLVEAGYDAVNLGGGMTAWRAAGFPVVNERGKKGSIA